MDKCANNLEKSSTPRVGEHFPCRYSLLTIWTCDNIEKKHSLYCNKDCMKKFCSVINFEIKKKLPLDKKELILHDNAAVF